MPTGEHPGGAHLTCPEGLLRLKGGPDVLAAPLPCARARTTEA